MTRRHWLVLGVGGLIVSAASRVTAASGPVQADAEAYAGSTVGEWACGPTARANYGGGGGHVRVYTDNQEPKVATHEPPPPEHPPLAEIDPSPNAPPVTEQPPAPAPAPAPPPPAPTIAETEHAAELEPHGPSFGAGGGLEHRAFDRLACNASPCAGGDAVPRALVLYAGRANLGYDWDYFGFRAGALGYQRWRSNTDSSPTSYVLPDAELRFGRRAGFHGGLGFGAYNVVTTFRPGAFLAVGYSDGRWAADLRGGVHAVFDGQLGGRFDLSTRYAVARAIAPGMGVAVSTADQISPEGRVFVVFTP